MSNKKTFPTVLVSIILLLLIIGIISFYYAYHKDLIIAGQPDKWAYFGDYFGGILSPIIAFISVIVLGVTLNLQRKELEEARVQFEKQATALEEQSSLENYKLSIEILDKSFSSFESAFNQMLLYSQVKLDNDIPYLSAKYKGQFISLKLLVDEIDFSHIMPNHAPILSRALRATSPIKEWFKRAHSFHDRYLSIPFPSGANRYSDAYLPYISFFQNQNKLLLLCTEVGLLNKQDIENIKVRFLED